MIRKKGSLIIENMLSSAMIIILILGICQVIVSKDKWHEIKNKEDEFILILLFMEVCKSITAFDEGVSQLLRKMNLLELPMQ